MVHVVFLDIDDVLNDRSRYKYAFDMQAYFVYDHPNSSFKFEKSVKKLFTPAAMAVYNSLVKEYNPKVVISSSWANTFLDRHLSVMFRKNGLSLDLHDEFMTKRDLDNANTRYAQIKDFLDRHPDIDSFVILDDEESGWSLVGSDLEERTVFAQIGVGLVESDLDKIRSILG